MENGNVEIEFSGNGFGEELYDFAKVFICKRPKNGVIINSSLINEVLPVPGGPYNK